MVAEITEEEMKSLTQSILIRYGIDFTCYEPKSLRRRIMRLMNLHDVSSIHELWVKFLRDGGFINIFMNEVSVGMTSMFRDPKLWKDLKHDILRNLARKDSVDVWHAGCSTGEEVYSLGILLREAKMERKVRSVATDINMHAIGEAKAGLYHKIKMVENETNYRLYNPEDQFTQYYTSRDAYAAMDTGLVRHTRFAYHNLITDTFPGKFDLILCRNVMIYFDSEAKVRLLNQFYHALNPGGFFCNRTF